MPKPTLREVHYGPDELQVLDFWKAESNKPTPWVTAIHGGSWLRGSKEGIDRVIDISALLKQGISVAAINYRFTPMATEAGIKPPVKAPKQDCARALQFARSKA